jgi:hypothetical protein
MKTYRVSDFEQGFPSSADLRGESAGRDAIRVETENVGNDLPSEIDQQPRNVGRRKTPADLLELIPSESPIQQAKLFEAARAAGINEKYARRFLSTLMADKRILVQKIPRSKAKNALGYVRAASAAASGVAPGCGKCFPQA